MPSPRFSVPFLPGAILGFLLLASTHAAFAADPWRDAALPRPGERGPQLTAGLDGITDSAPDGDGVTAFEEATIEGLTFPDSPVSIRETGSETRSDRDGFYSIGGVPLKLGENSFTITVTFGLGGEASTDLVVTRIDPRDIGDPVLYWNAESLDAVLAADRVVTRSARSLAIIHAAMYDTVNAFEKTHAVYTVNAEPPAGASIEAAVSAAAHRVMTTFYETEVAELDAALALMLSTVTDGQEEEDGVAFGILVADAIMATRANDGSGPDPEYIPGDQPGDWRPVPPLDAVPPFTPAWGGVRPFGIGDVDTMMPPPQPDMTSEAYTASYNEVKELGALDSKTRTPEQVEIGYFWAYDRPLTGPPTILYNECARQIAATQGHTMAEHARLFLLVNASLADAGIVCWKAKYVFEFWRPYTAIREGDTDGNPDTEADPDWEPLGCPGGGIVPDFTPPFPAYTSGHATFGAAAFRALANFYGTDEREFSLVSDELPGVVRNYTRFSQASEENGRSRVYLGVHWDFDDTEGRACGDRIADAVFNNVATPISFTTGTLVK